MRYVAGTTPAQVFPFGIQGPVSIRNNGPSTVYLDGDTSVNTSTSYPLEPTGVMTWKGDKPLFAVTKAGEAELIVSLQGNISDTSRVESIIPLWTGQVTLLSNSMQLIENLEVGSYQTVVFRAFSPLTSEAPYGQYYHFVFEWFDDLGKAIAIEPIRVWASGSGNFTVTAPVSGSRLTIKVGTVGISSNTVLTDVRVTGTTRSLPQRSWYQDRPLFGSGYNYSETIVNRGAIQLMEWNYSDTIFLPSWGNILDISILAYSPVATQGQYWLASWGDISLVSRATPHGIIFIEAGSQATTRTVYVPRSTPLAFYPRTAITMPPDGSTVTLALSWRDYDD